MSIFDDASLYLALLCHHTMVWYHTNNVTQIPWCRDVTYCETQEQIIHHQTRYHVLPMQRSRDCMYIGTVIPVPSNRQTPSQSQIPWYMRRGQMTDTNFVRTDRTQIPAHNRDKVNLGCQKFQSRIGTYHELISSLRSR